MRIGELARRAGVSTRSLRYYERQGLLPARRDANGYRWYEESDLPLVMEIRDRLASGFSLTQARPFVECLRAGNPAGDSCPDSMAALLAKLDELDHQLAELASRRDQVRHQLERARADCARPCLVHQRRGSADHGGSAR